MHAGWLAGIFESAEAGHYTNKNQTSPNFTQSNRVYTSKPVMYNVCMHVDVVACRVD
jgi:hypothetical protein